MKNVITNLGMTKIAVQSGLQNYKSKAQQRRMVSFVEKGKTYEMDPLDPIVEEACLELGIDNKKDLKKKRFRDFKEIGLQEALQMVRFNHWKKRFECIFV